MSLQKESAVVGGSSWFFGVMLITRVSVKFPETKEGGKEKNKRKMLGEGMAHRGIRGEP